MTTTAAKNISRDERSRIVAEIAIAEDRVASYIARNERVWNDEHEAALVALEAKVSTLKSYIA